jgi:hypothetical protein
MIFMAFARFVIPISDPSPLAMTKVASMKQRLDENLLRGWGMPESWRGV